MSCCGGQTSRHYLFSCSIRNIANVVEEEQDQLKIIEERTGEFKLDFQNKDEDSFIDEIDDSMSLDELMSLYEKKFKD